MDLITALAVSMGLLGGVAPYLFLTVGTIQIWQCFMGWASFYHCGGGKDGLRNSIIANIFGAVVGFIALLVITQVNLGVPGVLWAAIVVGVAAFVVVMASKVEALAAIPAAVYGFASCAGLGLLGGASLTDVNLANPLICTVASMVIGNLFGIASEKLAGVMKSGE